MANLRKSTYVASSNLTLTLASLATDSSLLTGRESTAYDNSSNLYLDAFLSGFITTGTSPTASKTIEVWVVPETDDSTWPDVFDGTDSAETVTSTDIKALCGALYCTIPTDNTSDRKYPLPKFSIAALFGGLLPRKFVVFVTHNTGVNFNSTAGNHQVTVSAYYENLNA